VSGRPAQLSGAPEPVGLPLSALVEDLDFYPREKIDSHHVREIADAVRADVTLPPLVAWDEGGHSHRIVDGWHRRRALMRVLGDTAEWPVLLKRYASSADAFADAVALNSQHGRKLSGPDRTRSAIMLHDLGVDDERIALALRVPPQRVEQLRVRIVRTTGGDPVPLKLPVRHLAGMTLQPSQIAAVRSAPGTQYDLLARQLVDAVREGLIAEDDDRMWELLGELHRVIGDALDERG
jgi:hypothetical protein